MIRFLPFLVALLAATGVDAQSVIGVPAAVEIAALNGTFEDLASELGSVEAGGLTLDLVSPRNRLTIHRNRLSLRPGPGAGELVGLLELELDGDGDVEAWIEGTGEPIRDRVAAPRQTVRVASTLRVERAEAGYRVTLLDPPPSVPVEVESGLGRQLLGVCEGLAALPFFAVDCDGLERTLEVVEVPLPAAGEGFDVPAERLGPAERDAFDAVAGR